MKINLSPICSTETTLISVNGEKLTVDSVEHDLSAIPEGGQVEGELPALGLIKRVNGVIEIAIEYHYDGDLAEPMQSTNEADYIVDCASGEVPSPIKWLPEAAVEEVAVVDEVAVDEGEPMNVATMEA